MSKLTKTPATEKTANLTAFVNKLYINGQHIEGTAKQVACDIKGQQVTLQCSYIADAFLNDTYTSSFTCKAGEKTIVVAYGKLNNIVSASIYIDNNLVFSSLSMQAVFTALNAAYNLSKSTLNNLYVHSNAQRKQATKTVAKADLTAAGSYSF